MLKEDHDRILNNKKIEDKNITKEYEAYNKGIEDAQKVFNMLSAIEEVRENTLREYTEHKHIESPEDIIINMEDIYDRERKNHDHIQEDKDKYSNPPI